MPATATELINFSIEFGFTSVRLEYFCFIIDIVMLFNFSYYLLRSTEQSELPSPTISTVTG
jgi:hypothetical protein